MTEQRISRIREIRRMSVEDKFYAVGVVSRFSLRKDRKGKNYWDLAIMDEDGLLEGKVWSDATWWDKRGEVQREIPDPAGSDLFRDLAGKSLGLAGKVAEFRGQPQYNFNGVYFVNQERFPPHQFVPRSPVPQETLERNFRELLDRCSSPLSEFLDFVFFGKGLWEEFRKLPAAVTHHHAYVAGLLEHTVAVAGTTWSLAGTYGKEGFDVDPSVAVAGALLHDLGKTEAYRLTPAPEMTVKGTFIDHIVLGYNRFEALAREFGLDEQLLLAVGHILISHHGSREFGSPVLPATPEAMIVSAADELDFRLFCWKDAVERMEDGREISDFNPSAQRRFWKWDR